METLTFPFQQLTEQNLNDNIKTFGLIDIYNPSLVRTENAYCFQVHMRESRRKAVLWVIKQNLKYLEDQSLYIYLTLLNRNEVINVLENLQIFGISSLVSNEWMKEENKRKFF